MFRSRLTQTALAAVFLCAAGAFTGASAVTSIVYEDSLLVTNGNPVGGVLLSKTAEVYESFKLPSTGSSTDPLSDLAIALKTSSTAGSLVITLWSNSANAPSTDIETIASISLASLRTAFGNNTVGILNLTNLQSELETTSLASLAKGTEYWVGFELVGSSNGSQTSIETSASYTGSATLGAPTGTSTAQVPSGNYLEMCTSSDTTCATTVASLVSDGSGVIPEGGLTVFTVSEAAPEPGTLVVLGSALTGLGLLRRRRHAKAAALTA